MGKGEDDERETGGQSSKLQAPGSDLGPTSRLLKRRGRRSLGSRADRMDMVVVVEVLDLDYGLEFMGGALVLVLGVIGLDEWR